MSEKVRCGSYPEDYEHTDWRYNDVKEMLSQSYLSSIASYIGAAFEPASRIRDKNGTDASIHMPANRMEGVEVVCPVLDVQMKSTSNPDFDREMKVLNFDMPADEYERLHRYRKYPALILMVLVLPDDTGQWMTVDDDRLSLSRFMLWYNVADCDEDIQDRKSIRLKIPLSHRVDADSLSCLLRKSANGEMIHNDR